MKLLLNQEEYRSVLKSYNNLLALFLHIEDKPKGFLECIYKWGIQMGISKDDLKYTMENPGVIKFETPESKEKAIEQIYDIVYIIYLDEIIEDTELELATTYAEKLGFNPNIVGELLKALVASPAKNVKREQVKKEIKEFSQATVMK